MTVSYSCTCSAKNSFLKGVKSMTVSYSGLWKMLQENGLRKQNLVDDVGLSPVTVSKMGKGRMVNDKIIDRICEYLKCQPRDIIEIE